MPCEVCGDMNGTYRHHPRELLYTGCWCDRCFEAEWAKPRLPMPLDPYRRALTEALGFDPRRDQPWRPFRLAGRTIGTPCRKDEC
jgi:hypothetical protein